MILLIFSNSSATEVDTSKAQELDPWNYWSYCYLLLNSLNAVLLIVGGLFKNLKRKDFLWGL